MSQTGEMPAGSRGPDGEDLAFFTSSEAAIAAAAMERIFPSDGARPGAREAGTVIYLDRALAGAEQGLQNVYRAGLGRLEGLAVTHYGAAFVLCSPAQQDELISALADGRPATFGMGPSALEFFEMLRSHTIEGLFSDPAHGGNRNFTGWKLLGYHGPQPSYSHAEQQLDAVIIRDRIFTAADYPLPATETSK